jgi:hypothetical protein
MSIIKLSTIDLRASHTYFIKTSNGQVGWFPDFNKEVLVSMHTVHMES